MTVTTVTNNPDRSKGQISFEERARQLEQEQTYDEAMRRKEKGSPYKEFAQLNMEGSINEDVMYKLADSPAASKIFWFIANHMDGYNALIASYAVFSEALDISIPTVTRGIKKLREMGLLYIRKTGATNVYMLNPDVIWKSWGNNRKYCDFPAKVIISANEQVAENKKDFSNQMHKVVEKKR